MSYRQLFFIEGKLLDEVERGRLQRKEYDMNQVMRQMPRYECHKQVWALKIKSIRDNKVTQPELVFEEDGYAPLSVDWDWYYKHKPQPGGYYVVYADGYKSFSPAVAFESGYTPL
jgi:hypothetical protein